MITDGASAEDRVPLVPVSGRSRDRCVNLADAYRAPIVHHLTATRPGLLARLKEVWIAVGQALARTVGCSIRTCAQVRARSAVTGHALGDGWQRTWQPGARLLLRWRAAAITQPSRETIAAKTERSDTRWSMLAIESRSKRRIDPKLFRARFEMVWNLGRIILPIFQMYF